MTTYTGTSGNDTLSGGSGPDQLRGGQGDDRYFITEAEDRIVEGENEGDDRALASVSYALRAGVFVETLATSDVAGTAAIDLTGNEIANTVNGNAGNNVLKGGGGNDVLRGYAGDDRLDGGIGADTMFGGLGNDVYVVDAAGDKVSEFDGEGDDRVLASVSYALRTGASIETLMTTSVAGTAAINLTGNEIANAISGNAGDNVLKGGAGDDTLRGYAGNDRLDGGTGTDTMIGGLGDDIYYVDAASDRITELDGQGNDRVLTSVSYALRAGASIETLSISDAGGTAAIDLTGNELANDIHGNAGNNLLKGAAGDDTLSGGAGNDTLNGGAGTDTMAGGSGDDDYYVDAVGDVVVEAANRGTDRVLASSSYVLGAGASIETLATANAAGTATIALTGNELANGVFGNAGRNALDGGGGNDVLDGGLRADTLTGGAGTDVFCFTTALGSGNVDTITDFQIGIDRIRLGGAAGEPFAALATGSLGDLYFEQGTRALRPYECIIYNPNTGALLYDADGSGSGAAVQFAILPTNLYLSWSSFVVSGEPNHIPTISSGGTASVAENSAVDTIVYQATTNDADGDQVFLWLEGRDASRLTIDDSGAVRLLQPANFENQDSYDFTVVATDSGGVRVSRAVELAVENLPEPTPIIAEKSGGNNSVSNAQVIDRAAFATEINPNLPNDDLPSVTITGTLSSATDRDYFAVRLAAGEVLYLDVDNTSGNLDAMLEVYRINGGEVLLVSNDDLGVLDPGSAPHPEYGHNTDSYIRIRVQTAGTYFFAISSFADPEHPTSGSYELNVSVGPPVGEAELMREDVEALISGAQWDHADLTYGFPTSASQYPEGIAETDEPGEFAALTAVQRTAVTQQLATIAAVSGLSFSAASNAATADLRFAMSSEPETAHASYPTNLGPEDAGGTAWFNRVDYNNPIRGNYAWLTFLHETGHALGLKHGHESPAISPGHDSLEYSIMTYRSYLGADIGEGSGFTNETWGFPTTLMMLDIAALQQMYGANFDTNAGNTIYRWSPTTGEMRVNGVGQGAPGGNRILMTVWDGGGTDTYDLSDYATRVTIDLRPGEWTNTGATQAANLGGGHMAHDNIANALLFEDDQRSLIENAVGGSGADTLIANQTANRLTGGAGADVFRWMANADLAGDVVTDFVSGVDKLDFTHVDGRTDAPNTIAFAFIGTQAFTGGEDEWGRPYGELRYEVTNGALILQGDTNGDSHADFQIRFVGITSLAHADFLL